MRIQPGTAHTRKVGKMRIITIGPKTEYKNGTTRNPTYSWSVEIFSAMKEGYRADRIGYYGSIDGFYFCPNLHITLDEMERITQLIRGVA